MASVDTSIYQNLLRPPKSVAEYDAERNAGQMAQRQNQLAEMMLGEKRRGIEQANAKTQAYQGAFNPATGKMDSGKLRNALGGMGDYEGLQAMDQADASQAAAQRAADKQRIEDGMKHFEVAERVMAGVQDQAGWDNAKQQAAEAFGPEFAAKLPQAYDARLFEENKLKAMSAKDRLANEWKAKEYDLGVSMFDETKTNNRATLAQSNTNSQRTAQSAAAGRAQSAQQHRDNLGQKEREFGAKAGGNAKPLPTAALKMQQSELDAIGIAGGIQADLGAIEKQIADGKLDFGPINNLISKGRNLAGMSSESSRNMASFKSSLEKLRNDSLRLNTGVQTDGDAQRAWSELFENINDKGVVTQRLGEIKKLNERAVKLRKMNVDGIRANYGRDPMDTSGYENQDAAIGAGKPLPGGWSVKEH